MNWLVTDPITKIQTEKSIIDLDDDHLKRVYLTIKKNLKGLKTISHNTRKTIAQNLRALTNATREESYYLKKDNEYQMDKAFKVDEEIKVLNQKHDFCNGELRERGFDPDNLFA